MGIVRGNCRGPGVSVRERHAKVISGLIVAVSFASSSAHADFYLHPWENFRNEERRPHLISTGRLYSTSKNFDAGGSAVDVSAQDGYARYELDVAILYPINPRVTGYARLGWGFVAVNRGIGKDTSFGLTDQTLGLNFRVFPIPQTGPGAAVGGSSLDLQFQLDIPAYPARPANNLPPLGDGSVNASAGGFLTLPIANLSSGSLRARGGGAFTYRTAGYSALLPWSAWLEFDPDADLGKGLDPMGNVPREKGLLVGAGLFGTFALSTVTTASAAVGVSSSLATGALNPAFMAAAGRLGYRFAGGSAFTLTGAPTIWGQTAPQGLLLLAALDLPLGSGGVTAKNTIQLAPQVYGAANQGFVNYTLEGRVIRVSDRLRQIKIDRGSKDGVELGQVFDIFVTKPDGSTGESVARCKAVSVKTDESSLSIVEYFREIWIDEGFVARRLVQ